MPSRLQDAEWQMRFDQVPPRLQAPQRQVHPQELRRRPVHAWRTLRPDQLPTQRPSCRKPMRARRHLPPRVQACWPPLHQDQLPTWFHPWSPEPVRVPSRFHEGRPLLPCAVPSRHGSSWSQLLLRKGNHPRWRSLRRPLPFWDASPWHSLRLPPRPKPCRWPLRRSVPRWHAPSR